MGETPSVRQIETGGFRRQLRHGITHLETCGELGNIAVYIL